MKLFSICRSGRGGQTSKGVFKVACGIGERPGGCGDLETKGREFLRSAM